MQSQIDLALNLDLENDATYITEVIVLKGTIIYEGYAAHQVINGGAGYLLGGGSQVFIEREVLQSAWFK